MTTSSDDGVATVLQGGEGCEGASDIIQEVDAVVGPVVSGGEITGESDQSACCQGTRTTQKVDVAERSIRYFFN